MKFRRFVHVVSMLVGAWLATACTIAPITAPVMDTVTTTREPFTLKVGILPFLSHAILEIAQVEGYFTEQGLAVEFVEMKTTNEFVPLLLTGDLDVAAPSLNPGFFNAIAAGGNIKMVLPLTDLRVQECAYFGYVVRKADAAAGKYAEPSQWKGAKVGAALSSMQGASGFVISQTLAQSGLSMEDIQFEAIDTPALADALRNGQIDIAYTGEPWVTRMTTTDDLVLLSSGEQFAPNLLQSFIAFGAKPLENPEIGQRFAVAYLKAVRQYLDGDTPRNREIIANYTQLEPELVSQICWSHSDPDGAINVQSIMDFQLWLQEQELLDRMLEPGEFFDTSFAEEANRILGKVTP